MKKLYESPMADCVMQRGTCFLAASGEPGDAIAADIFDPIENSF